MSICHNYRIVKKKQNKVHLHIQRVVSLGLLGVQQLDGHCHMTLVLDKHHLMTQRAKKREKKGSKSKNFVRIIHYSCSVQIFTGHLCTHLEAVLLSHDSLSFPLVAGLPSSPDALRGQVSPCRAPLPLRQVKIHHLEAHLVAHKVLQL